MPSWNELTQFISFLWPIRKTKLGLSISIAFVIIVCVWQKIDNFMVIFGVITLLTITWTFISGRILLPSKKITIAFSLKAISPESHQIIEQTILKLEEKLKQLNSNDQFRLIQIGTDLFSSNVQAEKYLKRKKISLIIHGNVWNGKKENSYIFDLKNFSFSYLIAAAKDSMQYQNIQKDVNLMLVNRDWRIEEINSLTDLEKVSNNLLEITLSIIAIALVTYSEKHTELSISLIEILLPGLDSHLKPEEKKIIIKENNTAEISLNLLRSGRLRTILHECYLIAGNNYLGNYDFTRAHKHFLKSLALNVDPIKSSIGLARTFYHLKDIENAIRYTENIRTISKHNPVYYLNIAFLSIEMQKYEESDKAYEDLRKHFKCNSQDDRFTISSVLEFLEDRIIEKPEETALLYAKGVIMYNYKSKDDGKKILLSFYESAKMVSKYKPMIERTKTILKLE